MLHQISKKNYLNKMLSWIRFGLKCITFTIFKKVIVEKGCDTTQPNLEHTSSLSEYKGWPGSDPDIFYLTPKRFFYPTGQNIEKGENMIFMRKIFLSHIEKADLTQPYLTRAIKILPALTHVQNFCPKLTEWYRQVIIPLQWVFIVSKYCPRYYCAFFTDFLS